MEDLRDIILEENSFIWEAISNYSPSQPRDKDGRWTTGLGFGSNPGGGRDYKPGTVKYSTAEPHYFEDTFNSSALTNARLDAKDPVVKRLRKAIRNGEQIDSIVTYPDLSGKKNVADGHHRLSAFMLENKRPQMLLNFPDRQSAWDYVNAHPTGYLSKLNSLFTKWNSYPGHPGRPGQRGGSLPRGASSAHVMSESEIIDKAYTTWKSRSEDPGSRDFALRVAAAQGFDGLPKSVSKEEFDNLSEDEYEVFHRGLRDNKDKNLTAEAMHKEFMEGEYYVSGNLYDTIGKGIYMTDDHEYAKSYAEQNKLLGVKGIVENIALPKSANILDLRTAEGLQAASKAYDEVSKINTKISDRYKTSPLASSDENTKNPYTLNVWEYLETKGYDGIRNEAELCLFNRTIAIVNQETEK